MLYDLSFSSYSSPKYLRIVAGLLGVRHYLKELLLKHLTWKCGHYGVPFQKM
jgi:hypothetical protein